MSVWEYELRLKAYKLRMVDRDFEIHEQAWMNREVKAEKKSGKGRKPIYRRFDEFFNYKKRIAQAINGEEEQFSTIGKALVEKRRREKNGRELQCDGNIECR